MVNLSSETNYLLGISGVNVSYQNVYWNLRVVIKKMFVNCKICSYHSFEALVLSVFPFEDKTELLNFWNGSFPSEYIIDKMLRLTDFLPNINLKPYQAEIEFLN